MISYNDLKDVIIEKNFDLLHQMINYPRMDIYLKDYQTIDNTPINPQEGTVNIDTVATDDYTYIQTVDCVHTFDKVTVANNDDVGSRYLFDVYTRYDDILDVVFENKTSVVVKFDGVYYTDIKEINNLYDIVVQFTLNG